MKLTAGSLNGEAAVWKFSLRNETTTAIAYSLLWDGENIQKAVRL